MRPEKRDVLAGVQPCLCQHQGCSTPPALLASPRSRDGLEASERAAPSQRAPLFPPAKCHPLLPPPPPPLTRTEGHVAALDGRRLLALAAPAALAAFANHLPLLDAFPAARRALRPDRQTDRQTSAMGPGEPAHPASHPGGAFADDNASGGYCFLTTPSPPRSPATPPPPPGFPPGCTQGCCSHSEFPRRLQRQHHRRSCHPYHTRLLRKRLRRRSQPRYPSSRPRRAAGGLLFPPTPAHLGPGARPPLCGAGQAAAGPARLGPLPGAVLGVQGAVGAILQALHALHRPRLHPQLAAGLAAGTPLLGHPAAGRTGRRRERGGKDGQGEGVRGDAPNGRRAPNAAPDIPVEGGMRAPRAGRGGLTPAGNTPGGYSADGSASASCRCRRSSCAPSGCRSSVGSRTWCTGCLRGRARAVRP